MHKRKLPIANPCFENWDGMQKRGHGRRFCDACSEMVHNLSELTEADAKALLERKRDTETFCIRYCSDRDTGEVLFREPSVMAPRPSSFVGWRGLAVGLAGLAMSACADPNPEPTEVLDTECVYGEGPMRFTVPRGEGNCPPPVVEEVRVIEAPPVPPPAEPPPAPPTIVEPEPPEEPCEPEVIDPEPEKRPVKGKRIRKRQGKKIRLAHDEEMQGLFVD